MRIHLETVAMAPGLYDFDVTSTYTYNGDRITEHDTVTLQVTAP